MKISQRGLDLIKEFESYLKQLPDGRCTTYICPAGKPTIGWGCTKGVKIGDIWTRQEAEDGLRRELAECEAAVTRMVTVEVNQGQYDALVSFAYNCGVGALASSSILRRLNRSDYSGAAEAFAMWNKARKGGKGRKVEMRGLTRRRAAEKALFLSGPEEAEPEPMPQKIEPPTNAPAVIAGTVGGGIGLNMLAADPVGMTAAAVALKGNVGSLVSGVDLALWSVPLFLGAGLIAYLAWAWRQQ